MNIEALERMADLLERKGDYAELKPFGPDTFYLGRWPVCAIGQATNDRWFRERGLTRAADGTPRFTPPVGNPVPGWAGVQMFFGLTGNVADHLFSVLRYPKRGRTGARSVAARIRQHVANWRN